MCVYHITLFLKVQNEERMSDSGREFHMFTEEDKVAQF